MPVPYDKKLKPLARELRKNMTDAERLIWQNVRRKQLKGPLFYRQKPIGKFVVDFCCPSAKLVVELDGGQHFTEEGRSKDKARDVELERLGLRVLHFTDREVFKNTDGVLETILGYL